MIGSGNAAIGERIRALREQRRMTQEQLAVAAGVTRTTIQNIEAGRTSRPHRLDGIADALGVPLELLLNGVETRTDDAAGFDEVIIRVRTPRQRKFAERFRAFVEEMDAEEEAEPEAIRSHEAEPDERRSNTAG